MYRVLVPGKFTVYLAIVRDMSPQHVSQRTRFSGATVLLGVTFVASLTLAGCSSAVTVPQASVPNVSQTQSPKPTPSHSGDFSIPTDFPADIPIHSGEIVLGSTAGESPNHTWAVEVLIDDLEKARKETLSQLESAGFVLTTESGIGTETYEATLKRRDFVVLLKIYLEDETGEKEIRYVVIPA